MILIPECDVLVTYTPGHNYTQNLSGHLFECFDYYFILKKKRSVKILIQEPTSYEHLSKIVENHYREAIPESDIIINENFTLVKVPYVLNVDDCHYLLNQNRNRFACKKFFAFACGDTKLNYSLNSDIIQLIDTKIYDTSKIACKYTDYTKKIYPNLKHNEGSRPFAHITKNCKSLSSEMLGALLFEYPDILIYSDYLTPRENVTREPVLDFNFSKYIYTPVSRHFDCSPRLIVECGILGIPVVLWNIDYEDVGLERRLGDYREFILDDGDEIFDILR